MFVYTYVHKMGAGSSQINLKGIYAIASHHNPMEGNWVGVDLKSRFFFYTYMHHMDWINFGGNLFTCICSYMYVCMYVICIM